MTLEQLTQQIVLQATEEAKRGKLLAQVLGLKLNKRGRYDTEGGDKTDLGLFRIVERIVKDGE